jgi:UDP-N-acetyl-D-galactosamine dehydrogenase
VGGHCIGVDPYYLTHKAQSVGYNPEVILSGRRINDSMGPYVAGEVIKLMIRKGSAVKDAKILVMGLTFKENCPDIRNSKVIDIVRELASFGAQVEVYEPWGNSAEIVHEYGITPIEKPINGTYEAIVLAVSHDQFKQMGLAAIKALGKDVHVLYDVKSLYPLGSTDGRL